MQCQPCREAISARIDREDPGAPDHLVDQHLATCAACRAFAVGASSVRRRVSIRPADPVPDLTASILARAHGRSGRQATATVGERTSHWSRWALLAVALTQIALAAPPVLLGHEAGATVHLARELGAWDLAMAAALLLVAFRPRRAAGLVPFAAALAVAMVGGAAIDVATGRTQLISEMHHLLELSGVWLLVVISRLPAEDGPLFDGLRRARPTLAA